MRGVRRELEPPPLVLATGNGWSVDQGNSISGWSLDHHDIRIVQPPVSGAASFGHRTNRQPWGRCAYNLVSIASRTSRAHTLRPRFWLQSDDLDAVDPHHIELSTDDHKDSAQERFGAEPAHGRLGNRLREILRCRSTEVSGATRRYRKLLVHREHSGFAPACGPTITTQQSSPDLSKCHELGCGGISRIGAHSNDFDTCRAPPNSRGLQQCFEWHKRSVSPQRFVTYLCHQIFISEHGKSRL